MSSFAIGTRHAALCADGKIRSAQITNYPDTFFTVPARVKVNGKTVTGVIYIAAEWSATPKIQFTPNGWQKNAALLPQWPEKCRTCYGLGQIIDTYTAHESTYQSCPECHGAKEVVYPREVTGK